MMIGIVAMSDEPDKQCCPQNNLTALYGVDGVLRLIEVDESHDSLVDCVFTERQIEKS